MKKMFIALMMMFAAINAFAATTTVPSHLRNHTLQLDVAHVDSLVVEQCDDGSKELQVKGNTDVTANAAFDMGNVNSIKLLKGKNPDDRVTFYINGEKRSYRVADIKSIVIKTVERAN